MKRIALILVASLISVRASAEGLEVLPKWHMTGDEACYSFDEAKLILKYDAELASLRKTTPALKESNTELVMALDQQNRMLVKVHSNYQMLDQEYRRLLAEKTEGDLAHENTEMLGWFVAGGVTLVAGGVIAALLLNQ